MFVHRRINEGVIKIYYIETFILKIEKKAQQFNYDTCITMLLQ